MGLVHWWLRDWHGSAWVWCIGGCEIGVDRHGGVGRGYGWCWVCLLMGWVCSPWVMGLLAVGGVRFASSFFSLFGDGGFDECGCGWVCD